MSKEIEEFMDNEATYNILRHACYKFNDCHETMRILKKYLDNENRVTSVPPVEVARVMLAYK